MRPRLRTKMKNDFLYLALALVTGALIPIQAATNTAFSKNVGSSTSTGLMVFVVALASMIVFALLMRTPIPGRQQLATAPWYGYLGGIIVATYVVMITILVPKIGVGTAIGLIVTGQIFCAVAIDHFGLFNTVVRTISMTRFVGMMLMIAGVYLLMRN